MDYLCVSILQDEGDYEGDMWEVLLKHTMAPRTFATVMTTDPTQFVMGEVYRLSFTRIPGEQPAP